MKSQKFEDHLNEKLSDMEFALHYLEAAREDGLDEFLYAIRDVAAAQEGGFKGVAERAGVGRSSMYKSLSRKANPGVKTIDSILSTMGLRISVTK